MKRPGTAWDSIRSYLISTLGLMILAIAWAGFLIPSDVTGGGASGLATLIFFSTDIPVGYSLIVLNLGLFYLASLKVSKAFALRSVYGVATLSVMLILFQRIITEPLVSDTFMATVIGGILGGLGVGMLFTQNGSSGGTDIVAMVIARSRNISPGRIIMYVDVLVISSSFLLFHSIEKVIYGYCYMVISSYVIDLVLTGNQQSFQIWIFTSKHEEIAHRISSEVGRGVTLLHGQGWYAKKESMVLLVMTRKNESSHVLRIVKEEDPNAFLSMNSVMGVFGEGFDRIKS